MRDVPWPDLLQGRILSRAPRGRSSENDRSGWWLAGCRVQFSMETGWCHAGCCIQTACIWAAQADSSNGLSPVSRKGYILRTLPGIMGCRNPNGTRTGYTSLFGELIWDYQLIPPPPLSNFSMHVLIIRSVKETFGPVRGNENNLPNVVSSNTWELFRAFLPSRVFEYV